MAREEQGLDQQIAELSRLLQELEQSRSALTDPQILATSQKLDALILEWHRRDHRLSAGLNFSNHSGR
ncbi:MAG: hypothetical protein C7B45_06250 [Sulfobacillus acidophilus]|uniref:Aspartyl-phosphate phosphatase Spo0E family protein n=1 Tax=Sulfobacillus acidophilus TaxID=53633 RepID=A0A2T2WJV9_9FIRM|nr:MAG: hypothetical protein C7B45_06250 [Sulfobacillus acidophilus]